MLGEADAPPILLPDPEENITSKHERKPFSIAAKQSKASSFFKVSTFFTEQ